jgi:hypothetical protein
MALVVKDRVQVSTSTTGTGTLTLGAAAGGFQDFSVIGDGNTTYYAITNNGNWEVGIGTYTASGTTLSRDTVLESSNSGNKINLSGSSVVFCTYPAEKGLCLDANGNAIGLGTPASVNLTNATNLPLTTGVTGVLPQANGGTGTTVGYNGFKNRLINAQGLINQRAYVSGTATTGANQYTVDRWRVVTSGQNLTFSTSANVVTFTAPAGGVEQAIEGLNLETGTYVLSWTGTATATVAGSSVANGGTVSITGGTNTTVRFTNGTFSLPQLEKGSTATSFDYRPYGTELALCERYYYKAISDAVQLGAGWNASTTSASTLTTFPEKMRIAPSAVEQTGTAANYRVLHGITATACSAVPTFNRGATHSAITNFTVASGLTAGQGSAGSAASGVTAFLAWSAEL